MDRAMLSIRNLHAAVDGVEILHGIDLEVDAGQVHAVMGPNGSGKSTLAQVLAGHPAYTVTAGEVRYDGQDLLAMEFLELLREKAKIVEMDPSFMSRPVNEGFSGGEKKRNEILQMALLEPRLAILDETDSGLDIDALRTVAGGINRLRRPDNAMVMVTHYQRLLNYVTPDHVHVLSAGRIVRSGGKELALELEAKGYDWLQDGADGPLASVRE